MDADPVATFLALTGTSNEETAITYLSNCNFDASQAAQLYQAASAGGGVTPQQEEFVTDDLPPPPEEPRGPTRLDGGMERGGYHQGGGGHQYENERRREPRKPEVDPDSAIEVLFSPPDYKFRGTAAEACRMGQINERYVVLNILEHKQFVSGQINRDIWRNDVIRMQMEAFFILFQEDTSTDLGQATIAAYKINTAELPYLAILDPLTKSILLEISPKRYIKESSEGPKVLPDYFSEKLTDFLDRKGPFAMPKFGGGAADEATVTVEGRGSAERALQQPEVEPENDADELAAALAMSEEAAEGDGGGEVKQPEIDMSLFASEAAGALKVRVRLPSGAWDVVVDPTEVSVQLLAQAILIKMDKGHLASPPHKLNTRLDLRAGFPPKSLSPDLADGSVLLKDTPLRTGDTINPHLKE